MGLTWVGKSHTRAVAGEFYSNFSILGLKPGQVDRRPGTGQSASPNSRVSPVTATTIQASARSRTAAFYDVDGTLIRTNIVHAFAFYAARQPQLLASMRKTVATAASLPLFWAADKISRKWFNALFYKYYEGESEDRLITLAEELFEDVIEPNIYPRATSLINESKRAGCRQVLVSGALDFTLAPLARYLGVDDVIANRLEFADGYATGKIAKPFVAGATKAALIRDYAKRHQLDLAASWGYSDSFSDYPMLAVVGKPTAVNPDTRLLSVARSYDWPVIHLK